MSDLLQGHGRAFLYGCAAFALALAVLVVWIWRHNKARGGAAQGWRKGEATIDKAWIDTETRGDDMESFRVHATYRYRADGIERRGEKLNLFSRTDNYGSRERAEERLTTLPIGGTVPVWFDPEKPHDSTLSNTETSGCVYLPVGCAFLFFAGTALLMAQMF